MRRPTNGKAPPKRLFLAALIALVAGGVAPVAASGDPIPTDARGLPLWEIRVFNDFPVRLALDDFDDLDALLDETPIASFQREQLRIVREGPKEYHLVLETRITGEEARALTAAGRAYETLPDREQEARRTMERIWAEQVREGGNRLEMGERGVYHTHSQIGAILYQTMVDHPSIADTFIIGNTVQGRPIWGIRISDNIGSEEAEPEVRMASTIHGNEPPGLELLLYLVEFLTDEYATDPDAANLVDNFEMHIIPCLNPDGLVAGTRRNANNVDLNRNYPVPDGSPGEDGTYSEQVETIALKNHGFAHNFVISENGHSGALVVNYPWDYTYTLAPDDAAIIQMSLEYSTYNLPMYNGSFFHGITNGAQWYVAKGSLQDWSYQETGCIDVTIECSNSYQPPPSSLDSLWLIDNKQSFIHWIRSARYGVNGVVTGSDTGLPLDATVAVAGISKRVYTDPDFGDYYKLLDTGTYDITYSASGYLDHTEYGVSVTWGTPVVLDVQLDPVAYGDVSGHVREVGAGTGLDAEIEIRTYPGDSYVTTAYSDAADDGYYAVNLMYGTYAFRVTSTGHTTATRVVTVDQPAVTEDFLLGISFVSVLFEDDFEAGSSQWSTGWGITASSSHSPTHSMTDSPFGDYADQDTNDCAMALPIDLTSASSCTLSFYAKWEIESNWDCCKLEISTDGGTAWTPLATDYTVPASGQGAQKPAGAPVFDGTQATWVHNVVDLSPYENETDVRFRFRLVSDTSVHRDGFYFDDFVIYGTIVATEVAGAPPGMNRLAGNAPNPFNPSTEIRFELRAPASVDLGIYDPAGRLVAELLSAEPMAAGPHAVRWDGRDRTGGEAGSGMYLYRLEADGFRDVRKMTLIR